MMLRLQIISVKKKTLYFLQNSLNGLSSWTVDWGVNFNCIKCGVMHLGKNNPKYSYTLNGTVLNETTSEKDLGVFIDPLLNFEDHINITVKKARKMSGLVTRTITYKSKEIMLPLFKSLIRPILEYGNAIWSPFLKKKIDFVESVQRSFTKCIIGLNKLEYNQRLKVLGLPSLEFRRLRGDLIETYKICNKIYDPATTLTLFDFDPLNKTRSNGFKITKRVTNHNQYHNCFY